MQLLLGNIGIAGRRHERAARPQQHPGPDRPGPAVELAAGLPLARHATASRTSTTYYKPRALKPLRPNQMSYWQNYPKFFVSLQKAWWGAAATKENNWAYRLPAQDRQALRRAAGLRADEPGQDERLHLPGLQPGRLVPEQGEDRSPACRSSSSWSSIDPLDDRDVASSGRTSASYNDVKTRRHPDRRCSACRRPASPRKTARSPTRAAGCNGTGRARAPPGEAKRRSGDHRGASSSASEDGVREGRRRLPRSDHEPHLALQDPAQRRRPKSWRWNTTARRSTDLADPKDATKVLAKAGEQLSGFGLLRDDGTHRVAAAGSTAGAWTQAGNQMARRDNADPCGIGQTLGWAWAWPANRRILYNARLERDPTGKPWDRDAQARALERHGLGRRRRARTSGPTPTPATPIACSRSS